MDLEKVKEFIKKPLFWGIAGAVLGLILGLIIGWGIFPVKWYDLDAESLRPDLQRDYLRNAVLAYNLSNDQVKAQQLYGELGEMAELTLSEISKEAMQGKGVVNTEQVLKFSQAVSAESAVIEDAIEEPEVTEEPTEEAMEEGKRGSFWLGFLLLLVLGAAAAAIYFLFLRNHIKIGRAKLETEEEETDVFNEVPVEKQKGVVIPGQEKPVAQFMTTYMFGDDLYDDSFTFDALNGEFLGECGVSIGDTIGVGEPKKISAFEIWLFDKNDVETVTKIFLSAHAFEQPNLKQKLESKGELILAEPGKQILLETMTLQLEARIVDLAYGELPLPENSYFQRFTLELVVWQK
jgi:hypothetical protein